MKKLLSYLLVLSLSFSASACKKDENKNKVTEEQALKGSIELWTAGVSNSLIDFHLKKFKEKYEQVTVINTFISEDKLDDKILENLVSAEPLPDVYLFPEEAAEEIKIYKSHFSELGNEAGTLKDNYINTNFNPISVEDKVIAIPWTVQPVVMFYRIDLFQHQGINVEDIRTWDDYILIGRGIAQKTQGKVKMLPIDLSNGGKFVKQIQNEIVETANDLEPEVDIYIGNETKALDVVNRMKEANIILDAKDLNQVISAAEKDKILTVISSSDFIEAMKEKLKTQSGKWGIRTMPSFEAGGNTGVIEQNSYIALNKEAKNNQIAMKFLENIIDNNDLSKSLMVEKGIFPAASKLYNEAFMDEKDAYFNNTKVWRYLAEIIKDTPYNSSEVKELQEDNK
jgi:ABC-type glycerol-3-phosphate transport system substrate-binding protein